MQIGSPAHDVSPHGGGRSSNPDWVPYVLGITLLALVVLAVLVYLGILVPANLFGALAIMAVIAALTFGFFNWAPLRTSLLFTAAVGALLAGVFYLGHPVVEKGQYQAVFLSNGQVYFGKLKGVESANPTLTHVYYLQSNQQNPQQGSTTDTSNPQLSLVKLGNELHGPEDMMALNRDQILFWENLKDSGKVVQAIKQNQKK